MSVEMKEKLSKRRLFEMVSHRQLSSEDALRLLKDLQSQQQPPQRFPGIPGEPPAKKDAAHKTGLPGKLGRDLVKSAAQILNVDEKDLSLDGDLQDYGFESVTLTAFADKVNETFELELMPTVFFELDPPTLNGLAGYLSRHYRDRMIRYYGESIKEFNPAEAVSRKWKGGSGSRTGQPIAVIGMTGVLPQSENLETFWQHLEAGNDLVSEVPPDRWDWQPYGSDSGARWGGFIKDVDKFDAEFFNISPREARLMDPQQRIFLESVWNVIEDAGYKASDLSGTRTGLFAGVSTPDYQSILFSGALQLDSHMTTSLSCAMVANRVSYLLNFHGPSEPIDTACSSSLIAVHRGVEAIRNGTCDQAIAGGVNVMISPGLSLAFYSTGMLAKDGRCKTFDQRADGYVRGEGVAAVFLKPLHQARADNDHIYAVIKSTAENHGGHAHSLTAPNANAQAALLVEAYERAQIDPRTVTYIETHGTGTELGDPVEINGLKKAFDHLYQQRGIPASAKPFCALGSVKTNIGHLETAAGIAGLIKVLLAMKYKKIPMNLHFRELNPYFELNGTPFFVVDKTQPWEHLSDDKNQPIPRRAGISSFGFGGSNVHVVLEEWQGDSVHRGQTTDHIEPDKGKPYLFVFSAKNEPQLNANIGKMIHFLEKAFPSLTASSTDRDSAKHIREDILSTAARIIKVNESDIHPDEVLEDWGFDQVTLSILAARLEEKYHRGINLETLYQYPSIHALALYLCGEKTTPPDNREVPPTEVSLADIAYTLQVGRESMEERLAVVASTAAQLWEKLNRYYRDNSENIDIEGVYRGNSNTRKKDNRSPEIKTAVENEDLEKIAQLFVAAINIDWQLLYPGNKPKRISLPTYPFERKRHWVENAPWTRENQLLKKEEPGTNRQNKGYKRSKIQLVMKNRQKQETPVETVTQIKPYGRKVVLKKPSTRPYPSNAVSSRFPGSPPHVQPGGNADSNSPARSGKDALAPGIKEILAAVLFKDPAEVNENKAFIEMGLDSILTVEFARRLEQTFQVEMKATRLYDYSTVSRLARYLSTIVPGQSPPGSAPAKPGEFPEESPISASLPPGAGSGDNTGDSDNDMPARRIKKILANILFMDPAKIDGNKNFIELGLDSILAVEFAKKLKKTFHLDIKATRLYDYPTVENLEKYIRSLGQTAPGAEPPSPLEAVQPVHRVPCEDGPLSDSQPLDRELSRAKISPGIETKTVDVAIIGISARFPGADNIWEYWKNLAGAVDSVTEVPVDRWDVNQYYEPDTTDPTKTYCKWGGFLQDIDKFDPLFFNISPAEAELLDPQQRLFLQECWRALEDAGYSDSQLDNINCGIYAGVMGGSEYLSPSMLNDRSILAARLSYFLNLKGPAVSIDTACSSSLTALHLACRSLIDGETEMMLAGGVTLYLTEKAFIGMSQMGGIISREGKCKTFDNSADGFVPGEGAAVMVLKLLEKAAAHGDHIYGVIKGSGINQDGKTNGITAPSAESQKNLELKVYKKFDINPKTISYVEAHGTGTKLGDPIEIEALTAAFKQYTDKKQFCPIGSVKTNLGHTSAASGAAGVIKVLLSMKHKKIPPSLHFHQENEHINFKDSPFFVNTKLSDWNKPPDFPRRAAISSFGYSGTNAHIIIEEPSHQARHVSKNSRPFYFIPLSARTEDILEKKFRDLLHWLEMESEDLLMGDIAYTLAAGRSHFNLRAGIVFKDLPDLKQTLTMLAQRKKPGNYCIKKVNKTADREETLILEKGINLLKELKTDPPLPASKYNNKLTALAHLYTGGYDPDWTLFYQEEGHRRISMPTYPFARERYWISADNTPPGVRPPVEKTGGSTPQEGKKTEKKPLSTPLDETGIKKQLENDLIKFITEILKVKVKDIDPNGSLMEYGFDSISFMEYMKRINRTYDIEFTVEAFFDLGQPTVTMLSECLYDRFRDRFTRYFSTGPAGAGIIENRETGEEVATGTGPGEPIAIIGISCIMPRSDHPEAFWRNLVEGKNLITRFPQDRWQQLNISAELTEPGPWEGGFLDQVDAFDAAFFDISPREARMMDPQQRIFLETVWKTIEDAGYKASDLADTRTGVFVGVSYSHYNSLGKAVMDGKSPCILTLNAPSLVANRVSSYLNLHGPSEAIDTAGSSSLTALNRAVEALRNRTCGMAAVGGVHVILNPDYFHYYDHDPGERPGIFPVQANGYAPGEGAGAVLLKPLKDAVAHQDHIYAVIKGTAENHTPGNKSPLTPVNSTMVDLFIEAHQNSQIDPGTISYIEAHDIAGDLYNGVPMEIHALKTAFALPGKGDKDKSPIPSAGNPGKPYCGIGSVKTNIGDLEAAAGIVGLIKVVLAVEHKKLPVTYSEKDRYPRVNLQGPPFYIVTETGPWECRQDEMHREIPRRAGVSSFGRGGTNVYAVLEESPARKEEKLAETARYSSPYLVVLSAKNEERLNAYAAELKDFLETNGGQPVETREPNAGTGNLRQKIEGDILEISNETLKINPEGYETSTIDAFIRRINDTFNLEITREMFNERPSIGAFIKYLARNYQEQFRGYYNRRQTVGPPARFIHDLADIAYTLQTGREAMPVRLAMVVSTVPQLIEKLDAYCQGKIDMENFNTGNINNAGGQSMLLIEGEEKEVLLQSIIKNRKWNKLGYCWVMGVEIDWNLLYPDERPKRISLPTYPFERKKYWWSPKNRQKKQANEKSK